MLRIRMIPYEEAARVLCAAAVQKGRLLCASEILCAAIVCAESMCNI